MADPQIRAIGRALRGLTERAVRKITLDVTANLVETTPRDTGWAGANWVPSLAAPFLEDLGGVTSPSGQDVASARGRQASGQAAVVGYRLEVGSVFVTNNVPYVPFLNDGSSQQQPAGFVQRAIAKALTRDIRGLR